MTRPALIATSWTSAGDVRPGLTGPLSPFDIEERIASVAEAGYTGIGFGLADIEIASEQVGLARLRSQIDAAGIELVQLEFLDHWWISGVRRERSDSERLGLLRAAGELGADHIKVGTGQAGDSTEPALLRDEFARLARQAAAYGTRIALEPGAGSALDLIRDAIPMVVEVDSPTGGVLLDVWHLFRSGIPYTEPSKTLPSHKLVCVELDDADATMVGTFFDDTFDRRKPCGEGDFDVVDFIRAMVALGYEGPWGIEHMSVRHRGLGLAEALAEARDAALATLREAGVTGR